MTKKICPIIINLKYQKISDKSKSNDITKYQYFIIQLRAECWEYNIFFLKEINMTFINKLQKYIYCMFHFV